MRGAERATEVLQLDFYEQFYFPPCRVIAAGVYYRKCANLIGKDVGQMRFPRNVAMPRVSLKRRKRQVAAYLAVTHGGFSQAEVANALGLTRNSVWHGCRTIETWRDDERVRSFLRRLETRLDSLQEESL